MRTYTHLCYGIYFFKNDTRDNPKSWEKSPREPSLRDVCLSKLELDARGIHLHSTLQKVKEKDHKNRNKGRLKRAQHKDP